MGHNLNLVANVGLKKVFRIVSKGRALVKYFHHSSLAVGVLREKQELLLPKEHCGHKLINDCPTRWNSTVDMLQHLLEHTSALHAVATDSNFKAAADVKQKLYDFSEQAMVENLIKVLDPIKKTTVMLSSESSPSLSRVVPTLIKVERALEVKHTDRNAIGSMKEAMLVNLQKRKTEEMLD